MSLQSSTYFDTGNPVPDVKNLVNDLRRQLVGFDFKKYGVRVVSVSEVNSDTFKIKFVMDVDTAREAEERAHQALNALVTSLNISATESQTELTPA